jgi:hypothetical protein
VSYGSAAKARKRLDQENNKWPDYLVEIPSEDWPDGFTEIRMSVWRSKDFLVQIFEPKNGGQRMTVSRTSVEAGMWRDGISWDELQLLKRQCGFGDFWAVEVYPADAEVVKVANMRHLWILAFAPDFAWRRKQ